MSIGETRHPWPSLGAGPGPESTITLGSDGHDKPFCTKAITIIDYFKNALGDTDNNR